MIHPVLFIAESKGKGRGIFTQENLEADIILEASPVIIMEPAERTLLDQTKLHDYIFEWGEKKEQCAMALGYVAIYNHSYQSNCEYEMDFDREEIRVRSVKKIKAGEELFINYNGNWNDQKRVWFDAK